MEFSVYPPSFPPTQPNPTQPRVAHLGQLACPGPFIQGLFHRSFDNRALGQDDAAWCGGAVFIVRVHQTNPLPLPLPPFLSVQQPSACQQLFYSFDFLIAFSTISKLFFACFYSREITVNDSSLVPPPRPRRLLTAHVVARIFQVNICPTDCRASSKSSFFLRL